MARLKLGPVDTSAPEFRTSNGRTLDDALRQDVRRRLVSWAQRNARAAPWRAGGAPYAVLVAEMLLQQTSQARVASVYTLLFERYPLPKDLAAAEEAAIRDLLRPLGLARRARTLVACAKELVKRFGGAVPPAEDDLVALPGVGNYVARATLCITFDRPGSAVDSAIGRLLRRLAGLTSRIEAGYDRELWSLAEWLAAGTGRVYFYGLVDVAGQICVRHPRCELCPLTHVCDYAAHRLAEAPPGTSR